MYKTLLWAIAGLLLAAWTPSARAETSGGAEVPWVQAGLEGGPVLALAERGGALFAGTPRGLFRCDDPSAGWAPVAGGLSPGLAVPALASGDAGFFAGTWDGVFRSSDGGASWLSAGLGKNGIVFLASFGPVLLAGVPGGGVYRSGDGGARWDPVFPGRAFSACAAGSTLFLGTDDGVYRSADGGATWVESGFQGGVVPALAAFDGALLAASSADGLYRSPDSGVTWAPSGGGLPAGAEVTALLPSGSSVYAGTTAGVFSSGSGGTVWTSLPGEPPPLTVTSLAALPAGLAAASRGGVFSYGDGLGWSEANRGLACAEVYSALSDGEGVLAGTGAGLYLSAGGAWSRVPGVPAAGLVMALLRTSRGFYAGTIGDGVYHSQEEGGEWDVMNDGLPEWPCVNALLEEGGFLFAGTNAVITGGGIVGGGVYRLENGGSRWEAASEGLPEAAYVTALGASGGALFAATLEGVYRSSDAGAHWSLARKGLPSRALALCFAASGGDVFVGTTHGVYRWAGSKWAPAKKGLKGAALAVNALASAGGTLLAGTDDGVYAASGSPLKWRPSREGMGGIPAISVASGGALQIAGTRGFGLWLRGSGSSRSWSGKNPAGRAFRRR